MITTILVTAVASSITTFVLFYLSKVKRCIKTLPKSPTEPSKIELLKVEPPLPSRFGRNLGSKVEHSQILTKEARRELIKQRANEPDYLDRIAEIKESRHRESG